MQKRRQFIRNSGILATASLAFSRQALAAFWHERMTHAVGLQLFTLFNILDSDVPGNLKKVAAIGYQEIESAFSRKGGYYGYTPKEFAAISRDNGLSWISHHVTGAPFKMPSNAKIPMGPDGKPIHFPPMKNLRDNTSELIQEASDGGLSYLVCASTPISTLDEIQGSIDVLNKAGESAKNAGITMAYHNHYMEFQAVEGKIPYDLLLKGLDPSLVKMELDLAWATKGGADPIRLFNENPGRFPLWHVKDISADMNTLEPAGKGVVDFKRIFASAGEAGMKHFFVEHDMPADPFGSITISYQYLQHLQI